MKKILLLVPDEVSGLFLTGAGGETLLHSWFEAEDFTTITLGETEAETGLKVDIDDCVDILRNECSSHSKCRYCRFCDEEKEMECMLNADIPEMW